MDDPLVPGLAALAVFGIVVQIFGVVLAVTRPRSRQRSSRIAFAGMTLFLVALAGFGAVAVGLVGAIPFLILAVGTALVGRTIRFEQVP